MYQYKLKYTLLHIIHNHATDVSQQIWPKMEHIIDVLLLFLAEQF